MNLGIDVSGVMLDMDGTVYLGDEAIEGAVEFIERLNEAEIPHAFITNNSSHTRDFYFNRLKNMGFSVTEDDIITSVTATAKYLNTKRSKARVFPLASPDVIEEFRSYGINITDDNPDTVLLTFDRTITYDKLNRAYHLILNGAELIATHPDDLCPTEGAYDVDIGPFIRLFESLTETKATVVGKPNPLMLEMAADVMGVDPRKTIMIGDRLYTDIKMAQDAEISSILVLSGETSEADLNKSTVQPTFIVRSVGDIGVPLS
ncbi:MAG TPA: HAD-IIA family hydrolase [Candidatus Methanomethylophilaceae archaeon]|nr:HAD-IIA family hydrolase [Candidatus Methanomethylophilaceae archaeon]